MSAARPWNNVRESPAPNPGAGFPPGQPHEQRPEGAMTVGARASDWHPTVVNLLVLIVLELAGYAALRYVLNKVV